MSAPPPSYHVGRQIVMEAEPREERGVMMSRQDFIILCEGEGVSRLGAKRDMFIGLAIACLLAAASLVTTGQYFVNDKPYILTWIVTSVFGAGTIAFGFLATAAARDAGHATGRPSYRECRDRLAATWESTERPAISLSVAWQRVVSEIARRKPTLGAVLTQARPVELRDRELTILLGGNQFHHDLIADEANREMVTQAIRRHIVGAEIFIVRR